MILNWIKKMNDEYISLPPKNFRLIWLKYVYKNISKELVRQQPDYNRYTVYFVDLSDLVTLQPYLSKQFIQDVIGANL